MSKRCECNVNYDCIKTGITPSHHSKTWPAESHHCLIHNLTAVERDILIHSLYCVHNTVLNETHQYVAQGLDPSGVNTTILDVSMHITTNCTR